MQFLIVLTVILGGYFVLNQVRKTSEAKKTQTRLPGKSIPLVLPDAPVSTTDAKHIFQEYMAAQGFDTADIESHLKSFMNAAKEHQEFLREQMEQARQEFEDSKQLNSQTAQQVFQEMYLKSVEAHDQYKFDKREFLTNYINTLTKA
ncbi:MAG: hypothetical protein V4588_00265 [Pseudomonadota bacterium]